MKLTKEEKTLKKINKIHEKNKNKYLSKNQMKKRIKNSQILSNIKEIGEDGLIYLKILGGVVVISIAAVVILYKKSEEA